MLAEYVEVESLTGTPTEPFSRLTTQLLNCPACKEDYEGLVALVATQLVDAIRAPGNRAGNLALAVVVFLSRPLARGVKRWFATTAASRPRREAEAMGLSGCGNASLILTTSDASSRN